MISLTCTSYRASLLPTGGIRLEIGELETRRKALLSTQEIASSLGKDVVQIDKLSRRQSNPIPMTRTEGRPTIERTALNRWLLALVSAETAASVFAI